MTHHKLHNKREKLTTKVMVHYCLSYYFTVVIVTDQGDVEKHTFHTIFSFVPAGAPPERFSRTAKSKEIKIDPIKINVVHDNNNVTTI